MLTENCIKCAKNIRFHSCSGNVKVCPGFIDYRSGCRRCVNVRSCKKLGKKIGILHLCPNFEYERNKDRLIPLEKFPDYEEYLERKNNKPKEAIIKKKRGRPKGSFKKLPRKPALDEARELLSQYEKELAGVEELDAADKAALKNVNYETQPINWSPETLANTIIDNNYDPRLFELVNEKDILKPTNPVQFIIDPRFLNISLFPMQLKISLEYFAAYCPDCSNTDFIRKVKVDTPIEEIIDRMVLYVNGICPKCGKSRYEHILEKKHHNYNTLVGISGQRSGKSIYHGILAAAVLGQYLALPNPVTFMKSVAQATFTMTFVGLRFQDAYDNLWRDFYANITESPWFKMYNDFLTEEGIRLGKPLIKQADTFVTYIGKRISVNPSGPDKRKLRGRCLTGNMLINTNKGLFRVSSSNLQRYLAFDRGKYYNMNVKKQNIQKHCVSCHFSNGLMLEASEDHRIPCYDINIYLTEAKDLQNKYVMCQLGGGFGQTISDNPNHISKQDLLSFIHRSMISQFEFSSYSRSLQLAILRFCFCKIIGGRLVLSKYDANLLAIELGKKPIPFERQDCRDYLIPGTNVYTKSELNEMFNIYVPEHLKEYIDKGIVFVKCVKVSDLGLREVYDIEVFSDDHLYSANGIIVHNTRILGSIDEVSWFYGKDASMTLDADEVAIALENSLKTVRNSSTQLLPKHPDIPQAHAIYISSPRSKLDKGMRLLKQSSYIDSMYGFHTPTWLFNPNFTKESFKDEYARDPIAAETNFGANPPFGDKQFISSPAVLLDLISKKSNVFEIIKYNTTKDSLGGTLRYPIIRMRPHSIPSILSIDAGYNNNSFALCLMHYLKKEDNDGNIKDVVACSGIIEIQPDEGLALSFPKIYDMVISRIIKEYNVKMLAVDRWQSIDIRQRVYEEFEVESIQYSVVYDDFLNLKDDITSNALILPKCEQDFKELITMDKELKVLVKNKPVSHLIIQMLTSKDTGKIVTKGEETSDDILRAFCLGHAMLIDEDYQEIFMDDSQEETNTVNYLGATVGYSNTSGGTNSLPGIGCTIPIS